MIIGYILTDLWRSSWKILFIYSKTRRLDTPSNVLLTLHIYMTEEEWRWELVKYFHGASQPQKLNVRKFLYDENCNVKVYYTWLAHLHACSCSLVRSYFKPANGLPDTKGSLTGSLPSRAMALSCGISSASAASHTSLYTDGNHESMNTGVSFEFLHGSSCSSVSKLMAWNG